ncbi:hypothetical protein ACHAXT_010518 [Thalassiosira profunda]
MASFSTDSFSALDDDLVVSVASYGAPEDLLNLALTCRRLGSKMGGATRREWRALARDAKRQKSNAGEWSLVNEAARSAMEETQTVEERACLPLRDGESWMARYHELLLLRSPLTFDQMFGSIVATDESRNQVRIASYGNPYQTALSSHIMRAGKHYASFTRTGSDIRVGVFRPTTGLDVEGLSSFDRPFPCGPLYAPYSALIRDLNALWSDGDVNYCAVNLGFRRYDDDDEPIPRSYWGGRGVQRDFTSFDWQGQERFEKDDTVGLLLDLDEGTLAVYRNGRRLGVMKSGLAGEYCWGASLANDPDVSMKISRGAIPE